MDVFISHSSADRKWAEMLAKAVKKHGLSTWVDSENLKPGERWQDEIESALNSARAIVLLVGPRQAKDKIQQMAWRAALEESWADSYKPLIPLLIKNAELPKFLSPWRSKALHVGTSPKDLEQVVNVLIQAIESYSIAPKMREDTTDAAVSMGDPPPYSSAAGDPAPPGDSSEFEDRLSYIEEAAGTLSSESSGDDPPSPRGDS